LTDPVDSGTPAVNMAVLMF